MRSFAVGGVQNGTDSIRGRQGLADPEADLTLDRCSVDSRRDSGNQPPSDKNLELLAELVTNVPVLGVASVQFGFEGIHGRKCERDPGAEALHARQRIGDPAPCL